MTMWMVIGDGSRFVPQWRGKLGTVSMILKRVLLSVVLAAAIGSVGRAPAQPYPNHALKIVVPFPAGGPTDVLARLVAERLSATFGQNVIVESRPGGAGGTVGAKTVASADPDGYTLLISQVGALTISPSIYKSQDLDVSKAFVPVALVAVSPQLLCVSPSLPVHSVAELIAYAKLNPGKVNFGSAGIGSQPHVLGELLKLVGGVN
ncbi:MAG TPA: tripartite tricarboxylate transporter substrate-binding protein, partial [Xanthobacteraceae bacterium]